MRILLALAMVLSFAGEGLAVDKILAGAISAPVASYGLCSAPLSINLSHTGTLATGVNASSRAVLRAGEAENSLAGRLYMVAANSGTNDTTLATYNISATVPVVETSALINTASSPDLGTATQSVFYDITRASGKFVVVGTRNGGTCTFTQCPHFRSYNNGTNIADTTVNALKVASGSTVSHATADGTHIYDVYTDQDGGYTLRDFNSSFTAGNGSNINPGPYGDIADDGTTVYATLLKGGTYQVRTGNLSLSTITDYAIFGGTVTTALFYQGGYLYAGQSAAIKKVRVSDMTIVDTMALQAGEVPLAGGMWYDPWNSKFYVVSNTAGVSTTFRRINLTTFTSEQFINVALTPQNQGVGPDWNHQAIYSVSSGANANIARVSLCN